MRILRFVNTPGNRAIVNGTTIGLILSLAAVLIVVGRQRSSASMRSGSAMPQAAFFGYWSENDGFKSAVVINNASNTPLTVNPTLYNLSGEPFAVSPIALGPRQQLTANVSDWLAQGSSDGDFKQGNLVLDYLAPEAAYLGAQVTVTNPWSSLSFDFRDEMPMSFGSSRLEGMWWQPDGASRYDLVLSNMEGTSANVAVHTSGEPSDESIFEVGLAPHQTQIVRLDEKRLPFTTSPGVGKLGGISITHTGAPGAVLAYGMLSMRQTGFCSHFPFEDPAASRSQVLAASHVLVGKSDVPGFAEETRFTSIALLRNASDAPIDVKPSISFIYQDEPRTKKFSSRHLLPQQVIAIDIGGALNRAGIRGPISGVGLTLTSTGKPGALVAHLTSYDQTHNHTFDVPLKDPAVSMNRFGGSYPWTLEGDTQSIIHVRNTTDDTSRFTVELSWEGGSYALPIQQLAPQQEAAIDIRNLRDSQEEDSIGRVIPPAVTSGQVNWFEHGEQALIGRAEVFTAAAALASSFSCGANCCQPETSEVYTVPASLSGVPGNSYLVKLMERRWRECDGASFGPYDVTTQASWLSSDTSVATTGSVSSSGVQVSFVGAGSAIISGTFNGVVSMYNFINHLCQISHPQFTGQHGSCQAEAH